ncbi:MAG: elongation factor Tu, partial [Deltaproteobacteria bacterium]
FQAGKTYTLKLATAEVVATASVIEERLDSSTLEVIGRHAPELLASEVGNVVFSLKNDIAADLFSENVRLGRFVIEDGTLICGRGIVRSMAPEIGSSAQTIHLDEKFIIGDDGSVVDLTRERGEVEFSVMTAFLEYMEAGNRVLFKLRDPRQIEPVALMAFEHNLNFVFTREMDRVNLILYKYGTEPNPFEFDGGGL